MGAEDEVFPVMGRERGNPRDACESQQGLWLSSVGIKATGVF